ncbi:hemerythrin domain-containing protein [Pseudonocardia saturnea]
MCEYCGCQDIPAIAQLTAEHNRALDHVRDTEFAARALDEDAARLAAGALARLLVPHTAVEERALFPALAAEFPEQIRILAGEHTVIEGVLGEVSSGHTLLAGWDRRLLTTMGLLRDHILKEQDGVFPAALANLSPDDWETIDRVRESVTFHHPHHRAVMQQQPC